MVFCASTFFKHICLLFALMKNYLSDLIQFVSKISTGLVMHAYLVQLHGDLNEGKTFDPLKSNANQCLLICFIQVPHSFAAKVWCYCYQSY